MKAILTTHKGMEDIAALEVKEIIGAKAQVYESYTVFNIKKYEDLFKLSYTAQSAIGIYFLLSKFNYSDIFNDFKNNIPSIDFSKWISKKLTFKVDCKKNYENSLSTPELESKFGEIIIDHIKKKYNYSQKVDLSNPDTVIFVYLTKNCFIIGIDFSGFDLSKRSFNIFTIPGNIKGTLAYSLIRYSKYKSNEILLDPFSCSGTITMEAALLASKHPVNFYNKDKFNFLKFDKFKEFNFENFFQSIDKKRKNDKLMIYNIDSSMKHINFSKKNSKIAGIDKMLIFSRMNLEWLDTKFKKNSVDKIVTKMPSSNVKDINKIYNEFFYQAEYILRDKGKIALIGKKDLIKKYSSKFKFEISNEKIIFSGKEEHHLFTLVKVK